MRSCYQDLGNCYLTLALGALLGDLGLLWGVWERERVRDRQTARLPLLAAPVGSRAPFPSGSAQERGSWGESGMRPGAPGRGEEWPLPGGCCQVHMAGLVDLHHLWGGED